jgi:hypothetical protein
VKASLINIKIFNSESANPNQKTLSLNLNFPSWRHCVTLLGIKFTRYHHFDLHEDHIWICAGICAFLNNPAQQKKVLVVYPFLWYRPAICYGPSRHLNAHRHNTPRFALFHTSYSRKPETYLTKPDNKLYCS